MPSPQAAYYIFMPVVSFAALLTSTWIVWRGQKEIRRTSLEERLAELYADIQADVELRARDVVQALTDDAPSVTYQEADRRMTFETRVDVLASRAVRSLFRGQESARANYMMCGLDLRARGYNPVREMPEEQRRSLEQRRKAWGQARADLLNQMRREVGVEPLPATEANPAGDSDTSKGDRPGLTTA